MDQLPYGTVHSLGDISLDEEMSVAHSELHHGQKLGHVIPADVGQIEIIRTVSPGMSNNEPSHVEIIRAASPHTRNSPYIEITTEVGDPSGHTARRSPYIEISTITGNDRSNYLVSPVNCDLTKSQPEPGSHFNARPGGALRSQSLDESTIRQVIMVNPGEDVQDATNRALANITENLNRQAQQSYALGQTPVKETVIEITSVTTPGVDTGYFSRDELLKNKRHGKAGRGRKRTVRRRPASQPVVSQPLALSQFERECHTPPTSFTAVPPVFNFNGGGPVLTPTALRPTAQDHTPTSVSAACGTPKAAACGTPKTYTSIRPSSTASVNPASSLQCSSDKGIVMLFKVNLSIDQ